MSYIGRQNLGGAYRQLDDISSGFDGSDTTHTMQVNSQNVTVGDVNQIILSLGGVIQKPGTDFTVSGSVLTFTTAPAANTSFFAILLGSDNGGTVTPTDGSVTASKIASSLGGDIVFNEDSNDHDFRIEGNGDANAFFLDAGTDRVYLGNNTNTSVHNLDARLQIVGTDFDKAAISMIRYSSDANGPTLQFAKSRNATLGSHTIVNDNDELGKLKFGGSDGSDFDQTAAEISGFVNGTPSSGTDMPGGLLFKTTADGASTTTERMRIESDGGVCIGQTTTSSMLAYTQSANSVSTANTVTNTSYSNHQNYWQNATNGSTSFNFLICISNTASSNDTEFRIQGSGATQSDGAYSGSGVDFGEYFEWADGNSSDEVRYGYSVVLDGNKIRKATAEDTTSDIIGIISAHPTIIGDGDIDKWNKKYLRDDFNKSIMEEYTLTTWTETTYDGGGSASPTENISYHTDNIPDGVTVPSEDVKDSEGRIIKTKAVVTSTDENGNKLKRKKLNPDWDSSKTYIPREERKEWDVVGLVGKLRMHKGQPTNPNWRKMRDISDTVEEWLVR